MKIRSLAVIALLFALVAACGGDSSGVDEDVGTIEILVPFVADNGVSGFSVAVSRSGSTRNATVSASGRLLLTDIPPGDWTVRLNAPAGYIVDLPAEKPVTVTKGKTSTVTFTARQGG